MQSVVKPMLLASALVISSLASAKSIDLSFDLPDLDVERYVNPYVAIWAEQGGESKPLLVWHLKDKAEDRWLPDIKRWWRKIGRYDNQADGLTGATKGPGSYKQTLDVGDFTEFTLYFEVVREKGGRSLVKTDINLNDDTFTYTIDQSDEIGQITIQTQ